MSFGGFNTRLNGEDKYTASMRGEEVAALRAKAAAMRAELAQTREQVAQILQLLPESPTAKGRSVAQSAR